MSECQVELRGGPLDGLVSLVAEENGVYLVVPGTSGRALYEPEAGGDPDVWTYRGMVDGGVS
jgi:hypothetical protein